MHYRRHPSLVLFVLVLCVALGALSYIAPASALAASQEELPPKETVERLTRLLSGRHGLPTKKQLESMSPNIEDTLRWIGKNRKVGTWLRTRALASLQHWPNEKTWSVYRTVLASSSHDLPLQHQCLQITASVFPKRVGGMIASYLEHGNPSLRLTAAYAFFAAANELPRADLLRSIRILQGSPDPQLRALLARQAKEFAGKRNR